MLQTDRIPIWLAEIEGILTGIEEQLNKSVKLDRRTRKALISEIEACNSIGLNLYKNLETHTEKNTPTEERQMRMARIEKSVSKIHVLRIRMNSLDDGLWKGFGTLHKIWTSILSFFAGAYKLLGPGNKK